MQTEIGMQMETRTCKCGCKATFRVMPASKQEYTSIDHMPIAEATQLRARLFAGRPRRRRPRPEEEKRPSIEDQDPFEPLEACEDDVVDQEDEVLEPTEEAELELPAAEEESDDEVDAADPAPAPDLEEKEPREETQMEGHHMAENEETNDVAETEDATEAESRFSMSGGALAIHLGAPAALVRKLGKEGIFEQHQVHARLIKYDPDQAKAAYEAYKADKDAGEDAQGGDDDAPVPVSPAKARKYVRQIKRKINRAKAAPRPAGRRGGRPGRPRKRAEPWLVPGWLAVAGVGGAAVLGFLAAFLR